MPNGNADTPSLSQAVERVIQRSQRAFFAQFQLLRIEAEEDLARTLEGAAFLMAGLSVLATAWVAFMVLAVYLLREPLSLAASLALIGSCNLLVGACLLIMCVRTMRRLRVMRPDAEPDAIEEAARSPSIPEQRQIAIPAIEKSEEELKQTVDDLLATIHDRLDFSKRIADRPMPWVLGSLVFGFLLAHPRVR